MDRIGFRDLPSAKVVVMGKGDFAVGGCICSETGLSGLLYMPLPERREPGTDTTDLFPIGSVAEAPAALIYFTSPEAIQQTIGVLYEIKEQQAGRTELNGSKVGSAETFKFDLVEHIRRQRAFSENTFGPGTRTAGVIDHIRKELTEIEAKPDDVSEWVDVVLLALDGAWRAGYTPEQIAQAIDTKQVRNETRNWPDWRTAEPGKAIEHIRGEVCDG